LLRFLRRSRRKSSKAKSEEERADDRLQRRIDTFQPPPKQEGRFPPVGRISFKQLRNEVNDYLREFQYYAERLSETSLGLEELSKLQKSGDISESIYRLIMNELDGQLSLSAENIYKLREHLEIAKAKARLEWAKRKVGVPARSPEPPVSTNLQIDRRFADVLESDYFPLRESSQNNYPTGLQNWESMVSRIDRTLSSLPIDAEAAIVEWSLSLIKEKIPDEAGSRQTRRALSVCRQRVNSISERWASTRSGKIEEIMNSELEASKIRHEIKKVEARFSVGEITQDDFERRLGSLRGVLRRIEKEVSDIRSFIDDMDMKIFRCSELLREIP